MTEDKHTGSDNTHDGLPEGSLRELTDGLMLLWRARNYARVAGVDRWEFAIEIQQFYDAGLSGNELRWLVAMGYAEHAEETSVVGDARRSFKPTAGLSFSQASALVLTESGTAFASQAYAASREFEPDAKETTRHWLGEASSDRPQRNGGRHPSAALKPTWDAQHRQLRVGGEVVKWFRVPAPSQEAVLAAFEEESWPDYIDDPLPCVADGVPKQRLNNAITRLNSHQIHHRIHFHANGRGEGIGWKLIGVNGNGASGKQKPAGRFNGHRA